MLETGLNVPLASSCGRLFDGVAAALGLCADRALFEGQGAMELEALAESYRLSSDEAPYPFSITEQPGEMLYLDSSPMWEALLEDLAHQMPIARIAARFHHGLAKAICDMIARLREPGASAGSVDTVALSGGCFQNKLLFEAVVQLLESDGLTCLSHAKVPTNDGGLALGQAAIAAARHLKNSNQSEVARASCA